MGGYKVTCSSMPIMPRKDVATPTVDAGIPSPPVNKRGRSRRIGVGVSGSLAAGARYRGVDRNSDHMLPKAPRWKS